MSTLLIQKVSGVLFVKKSTVTNPKSYFNAKGNFQGSDDNLSILITISDDIITDQYTVTLGSLTVGTSTPSTMSSSLILLNSIFGT